MAGGFYVVVAKAKNLGYDERVKKIIFAIFFLLLLFSQSSPKALSQTGSTTGSCDIHFGIPVAPGTTPNPDHPPSFLPKETIDFWGILPDFKGKQVFLRITGPDQKQKFGKCVTVDKTYHDFISSSSGFEQLGDWQLNIYEGIMENSFWWGPQCKPKPSTASICPAKNFKIVTSPETIGKIDSLFPCAEWGRWHPTYNAYSEVILNEDLGKYFNKDGKLINGNENLTCIKIDTAIGPISVIPEEFVRRIFELVLGLAGGIALILIIISGYRFMVSQGNPETIKAASEQLTSAIIGLLFIILSFVILQIIGVDILNIPGFTK